MIAGISTADLGTPAYELACRQHSDYIAALKACGLTVTVLPPDPNYPDSTFVEDTAVLLPGVAVLTRPGAASRRGETLSMFPVLKRFFGTAEVIESPGTLEGGDVMARGDAMPPASPSTLAGVLPGIELAVDALSLIHI